jgi:membrane-associated phospholipid phosphatase
MKLTKAIPTFFKGFSLFLIFFSFLQSFLFNDKRGAILGSYLILSILLNGILKEISKNFFGNTGSRPDGAKNCGIIVDCSGKKSTSYGMPSGHSQNFAMVATLIFLALYKNSKKDKYFNIKVIILVFLTICAMYMRIYVEGCHTLSQTVVGASIGVMLGYFFDKKYINPFN